MPEQNNTPTKGCWSDDLGKLMLRLAIGFMLFHGIGKVKAGIDWMPALLESRGLPGAMAYGVYVGECVAPVLILIGLLTRVSGLIIAFTMVIAVYTAHPDKVFSLTEQGASVIELNALYFLCGLALLFLGPGRLSASRGRSWWA